MGGVFEAAAAIFSSSSVANASGSAIDSISSVANAAESAGTSAKVINSFQANDLSNASSAINNLKGLPNGVDSIDNNMNFFQNQYNFDQNSGMGNIQNTHTQAQYLNSEMANKTILDDAYSKAQEISSDTGSYIAKMGTDFWNGLTTRDSVLTADKNGKTDFARTMAKGAGRFAQNRIMKKIEKRFGKKSDYFDNNSVMMNKAEQFNKKEEL